MDRCTGQCAGMSPDAWNDSEAGARQLNWRKSDAVSEQIHSSAIRPSRTR